MPQYFQKYTVVCFFGANPRTHFSALDWPLHVTILDTFKTDWPLSALTQALEKTAQDTKSIDVTPTKQALLGPDKDVPVKLLRLDDLLALHSKLLEVSRAGSFVYNSPEFVGPGFLPHATDQKDSQVYISKTYHLANISLVDMFPNNDHMQRAIIATFNLKG
jgi:hypothetical protein